MRRTNLVLSAGLFAQVVLGQSNIGIPVTYLGGNTQLGTPANPYVSASDDLKRFELEVNGNGQFGTGPGQSPFSWGKGILLRRPNNTSAGSAIVWDKGITNGQNAADGSRATNYFITGPQNSGVRYSGDFFTGLYAGEPSSTTSPLVYVSRTDGNITGGSNFDQSYLYSDPRFGLTQYMRDVNISRGNPRYADAYSGLTPSPSGSPEHLVHPRLGINTYQDQIMASLHVTNQRTDMVDGVLNEIGTPIPGTGTVRFDGLPTLTSTRLIGADDDGNLTYHPLIAGGGGAELICSTVGRIPKVSGTNMLDCSQIFDNGTNVGIGNTAPVQKLHVTGNMTATGFVTAQDASLGFSLTSANARVLAHGSDPNVGALAVGFNAGLGGSANTNVGDLAGNSGLSNNFGNTMVGYLAGANTTASEYNTFLGDKAGGANTTGKHNVAVGAGFNSTGLGTGPSGPALVNTGAFGFLTLVSTCHTQRFGNTDVRRWGFGVDPTNVNRVISVNLMPTNIYTSDACGAPVAPGTEAVAYMDLGGIWYPPSDRNLKSNVLELNGKEVLTKLAGMPMYEWNYTHQPGVRHFGPMAQDFYAAFKLGNDDVSISTVDPAGVALASIKGLNEIVVDQKEKLEAMSEMLGKALDRIAELEHGQEVQRADLESCCSKVGQTSQGSNSLGSIQVAPNPFSDRTTITYSVSCECRVQLQVTGPDGKMIATLVDSRSSEGTYTIDWNTADIAPGVYTCTLLVDGQPATKQVVKVAR